jgi:hypothetical protein
MALGLHCFEESIIGQGEMHIELQEGMGGIMQDIFDT